MASGGCSNPCDNDGRRRVQIRPRSPPSPRPIVPPGVQVRPPTVRRPQSPLLFRSYRPPPSSGNVQVRPCTPPNLGGGGGGVGGGGYVTPNQDFLNSSDMSSFDPTYGSSYYNSSGSPGRIRRTTSTTIITTEEEDEDDDEDEDEDDDDYGGPGGGGGGCNGPDGSGGGRGNATYTVAGGRSPGANATYTVNGGRSPCANATYTVGGGGGGRGNTTYNVSGGGLGGNNYDVSCGGGYRDPPGSDVNYLDFSEMDYESSNYSSTPPPGPYSPQSMRGPIPGPGCPGGARDGQGPNSHNKTFTKIIKKVVTESPSNAGAGGQSPCPGGSGGGGGHASMNQTNNSRGMRPCAQSTPRRGAGGGASPCGNPRCPRSASQSGAGPSNAGSTGSCGLTGEVQRQLAELECTERAQINSDLAMFQQARRRLVEATTTISSSQPPVNFSGNQSNNSSRDNC